MYIQLTIVYTTAMSPSSSRSLSVDRRLHRRKREGKIDPEQEISSRVNGQESELLGEIRILQEFNILCFFFFVFVFFFFISIQ